MTAWIAGVTALVWAIVAALGLTAESAVSAGFIPVRLTLGIEERGFLPALVTPFTSALLHANLLHIGLNLLMLLVCGAPVEKAIGGRGLLVLYIAGAIAAAAAQWAVDPASQIPVIGASGAISAIVGAYSLLFGRSRVKVADARLARALHVLWLGAAWVGLQLLLGFAGGPVAGSAIAIFAHIGGFFAGLLLVVPLHRFRWRHA